MPVEVLNEGPFLGLDRRGRPERIAQNRLAVADNVLVDAGDLWSRPGRRGQLSSVMGGAVYTPAPILSSGATWVLFVAAGKVYKWQRGASTAAEVTPSLTLASSSSFIATGPSCGFLVDGTGVWRVDLSSTSAVAALSKPSAPTAALMGQTLEDTATAANWYDDRAGGGGVARGWLPPASTSNLLANASFDSALSGSDWTAIAGGARDATVSYPHSGAGALKLSLAGDGARQALSDSGTSVPALTASSLNNFTGAPQTARTFQVSFWVRSGDTGGDATVEVEVLAYYAGGVAASVRYTAAQAYQATTSQYNQHSFVASFNDLDTDPNDIELVFVAGLANTAAVWVDDVDLRAVSMTLLPTLAAAGDQIEALTYAAITGGTVGRAPGTPAPDNAAAGYSHRQYIFRTFGTAQDWRAYPLISARVTFPRAVLAANPSISLRLGLATSSSALSYTAPGLWTEDGKALVWALDGIPTATLQSLKYLVVEVVGDQVGGVGHGQALFRFGPIQSVGALVESVPVWYKLVEIDGSADATNLLDVHESDVSASSVLVTPTADRRMVQLTIPARANSSSTHWALYRYGGSLITQERGQFPFGMLVGMFSWSQATFAFGAGPAAGGATYPAAPANPYLSWTSAGTNLGGTLIDNTPDSFLQSARVAYEGREPPPSTPRDVALWDSRVWLLDGSADLYGSWIWGSAQKSGPYFSRVVQSSARDPHAPIRGWWAKAPIDAGDQVQRIVALPDALAVLTSQGLWLVEPAAEFGYSLRRVDGAPGLIARRAVCVRGGQLFWLSHDGVYTWGGAQLSRISDDIALALPPLASTLQASALALSSLAVWGSRLLLFLPDGSGDSAPTVAYVREEGSGAWTRWKQMDMTGGVALHAPGDLDALLLAGQTGQLWLLNQDGGDKATPAGSTTGVAVTVATRVARSLREMLPGWLTYDLWSGEAADVTFTVTGDVSAAADAIVQAVPAGLATDSVRVSHGSGGRTLQVQVDATTAERLRLRGLQLDADEGIM